MKYFSRINRVRDLFGIILLLFVMALGGIGNTQDVDSFEVLQPEGVPLALPDRVVVEVPTPAYGRYLEIVAQAQKLREEKNMEGLEKLAAELRASRETLDGGTWLLSKFYKEVVKVPKKDEIAETAAINFYEVWSRGHPESITAQVCLAQAYTNYAWNARGGGYSNTVTREGWRLFEERLGKAWTVLEKARQLSEKCPEWVSAAQTVAMGQGWEQKRYFEMMDEAIRTEPTYGSYYTSMFYWMLPRWHGEEGDFEKKINELANQKEGQESDIHYARLTWMAHNMGFSEELVFETGRLDWPRIKRGFTAWLEVMPDNTMVRMEFTRLALLAGDNSTAKAQFEITGGSYWPSMWGNDPEKFEQARRQAYFGEIPPARAPKSNGGTPTPTPTIANPETVKEIGGWIMRFSGLMGGIFAGIFCWILAAQGQKNFLGAGMFSLCLCLGTMLGTFSLLILVIPFLAYVLFSVPRSEEIKLVIPQTPTYVAYHDTQHGPYPLAEILDPAQHQIPSQALYWQEGLAEWRSFSELKYKFSVPPTVASQGPWSPGSTFLWLLVLIGGNLLLQSIASGLAIGTQLLIEPGQFKSSAGATRLLYEAGSVFTIYLNVAWITALLLLVLCGCRKAYPLSEYLAFKRCQPLWCLGGLVGGIAFACGFGYLSQFVSDTRTINALELMQAGRVSPGVTFLAMVIFAPLVEEMIFRGFTYTGWIGRFGIVRTSVISAAAFSMMHFHYGWTGLLGIFIFGMILAYVRWKSDSILPSVVLHLGYNLAAFLSFFSDQVS